MTFIDAIIHLMNFVLPALAMALFLPTLASVIWFKRVRSVGWLLLVRRVAMWGMAVLVAGLVVLGRDGAMLTYAALVVAAAVVLWWAIFKGRA